MLPHNLLLNTLNSNDVKDIKFLLEKLLTTVYVYDLPRTASEIDLSKTFK